MIPKWIIADTHFGHKRLWTVLNPGSRPYNQDKLIIKNWRKMVQSEDTILHLGDVFVGLSKENFKFPYLPGKIYFFKGNHDLRWKIEKLEELGWKLIEPFYEKINDKWFSFSHEPEDLPNYTDVINIHGHIHDRDAGKNHINICPEKMGYKPILLEELING